VWRRADAGRAQTFWILQNMIPLLAPQAPNPAYAHDGLAGLAPLAPCLALCALFLASARFSEGVTAAKYPAYKAYQSRVAMFNPLLTPVWGAWLGARGEKEKADAQIWGEEEIRRLTE
jgi:hypothetical protein